MSDAYDPQAPEGSRPSSQYISKKDWRVILAVLVVVAIVAWPGYLYLLGKVNATLCKKSFRKIGDAMLNYAADNDDHLPFAYESTGYYSKEVNVRKGYAYTWQWQLNQYVGDWDAFKCRAAHDEENTRSSDGTTVHESSYGMLSGYGGLQLSSISTPGERFLVSETTKSGLFGTVDPLPIRAGGTTLADDGFVIGFDNEQEYPNSATVSATRLAYPDSAKYGFTSETGARHPSGLQFLFVDGHFRTLNAEAAKVNRLGAGFGSWDVPKKPAPYVPRTLKP
jgi:prepilin-type processing-associated H-X9-DG protein